MICIWCNLDKNENDFYGKNKHCKKCHLQKYKNKERIKIEIECPKCNEKRQIRKDAYNIRKNDYCNKCSPLFNKQLYKSEHNMETNHPIYKRWLCMKQRVKCEDKKKYYKDKNIIVCDEWLDYKNFYNWCLSNGFNVNLELDRIDENKNYCPENCQWITHKENTLKIKNLFGRVSLL